MSTTRIGPSFRPKACLRCGGDAYLNREDDPEWVCLQCGRVVPTAAPVVALEGRKEARAEAVPASRAA